MKDLWSLVNFLQISPFTDKQWWNRAIERPLNEGNDNALKYIKLLLLLFMNFKLSEKADIKKVSQSYEMINLNIT